MIHNTHPWRVYGARLRRFTILGVLLFALGACGLEATRGIGARLATLRPPPTYLPPVESAGADALLGGADYSVSTADANWGVGYLAPTDGRIGAVDLPLFRQPGQGHWGWLTRGRAYTLANGAASPPRPDAWLRLLGRDQALVVLQEAPGGWLRVRWGRPDDAGAGQAWTRRDLSRGQRMTYVRWPDAFIGEGGLTFRDRGVAYNLRSQPGLGAPLAGTIIGEDYDITAIRRMGDWMLVRVHEPAACAPPTDGAASGEVLLGGPALAPAPRTPRVRQGWVKWRDADKGPWLTPMWPCLRGSVS